MAELNDRQRKIAFAGIVVALAFVGIYLTLPTPGSPAHHPAPRPTAAGGTGAPAGPATAPPGISTSISSGTFDIYRLLPFSQRDFAAAADVGQRFMVQYETYRYDESPQIYMQRLQGLVTTDLANQLSVSVSAPGLIDQRKQDQQVAQGSASIDSIRSFGGTSITFLVTGHQELTKTSGTTQNSQQFAVTVAHIGTSWQVYSYELANIGQNGDTSGSGPG